MRTAAMLLSTSLLLLAACSGTTGQTPAAPPSTPTATTTSSALSSATTPIAPSRMLLWVAPSFSAEATTPAGALLAQQLALFQESHPGLAIEVRIKAPSGTSGLLETLTAASQAAPAALPDALVLDSIGLNTAALKGLIVPLEGLVEAPSEPDWYGYAVEAARVDGSPFGVPLGADAQVLAYRTDIYMSPPLSWSDILAGPSPFLFPAGDPTGSFTLAQYMALDARLFDDAGRPALDPGVLEDILEFYKSARTAGVLPLSVRQYTASADTWAAFRDGRAIASQASFSAFLAQENRAIHSAIPLPTRNGSGICFASSWSWAVVTRDPARQRMVAQLLEWLTRPDFLGPWTRALGLLPPTAAALRQWPAGNESSLASRLVTMAIASPSAETLGIFGPPLQQAAEAVLSGRLSPQAAAVAASQAVRTP